jgi:hypothetical protein
VLVVSASKDRSDAFSTFVKRLINEVPMLQYLQPDPSSGHRDSNLAFDVGPSDPHQAPSVRSVGITGQLTGGRASIIIADDVEVPKNSLTITMRDKLAESIKEFDAVLVPNGEIIYLGTPQIEFSVYNQLPERGYEIRIWPARYPSLKDMGRYKDCLAPMLMAQIAKDNTLGDQCFGRGAATEPSRFPDKDLLEREASYGRAGFALQFMLDTTLSDEDRYPLKLSDLIVLPSVNPEMGPVKALWGSGPDLMIHGLPVVGLPGDRYNRPIFMTKEDFVPYQGVVMFIDPSGKGSDETAYAIVGLLNGMLHLMKVGGFTTGFEDSTLKGIAEAARDYKVNWIQAESNYGGGMFARLLQPWLDRVGYGCTIEDIHSAGQKERRIIDTLLPVVQQHRLVISEELVKEDIKNPKSNYQLFFQFTRITREKGCLAHDDRIDALAGAVAYWLERMSLNTEMVLDERKQEKLQQALDAFEQHVFGRAPSVPNWNHKILN